MPSGDTAQSVLGPASLQAASIHQLWSLMLGVSTAVFIAVLVALGMALIRSRRGSHAEAPLSDAELGRAVTGAVTLTVVVLLGLLVASVWTGRAVAALAATTGVSIAVTGHQWWWEVVYEDNVPSRRVMTANEIHLPLGQPVVLKVTSRDVIHSFWLPNLQGKRDLIPGYTTAIWIDARRAGRFRGQCAEFCGLQHAHMAFDAVVEPAAEFARWLDGLREPAHAPATDLEQRGQEVFMGARCATCHTVRGTEARGQVAPDLTHIASRTTLGAGTLPNTREHMAAWIEDPQASKPGNQMPPNPLDRDQLAALLTYLESLR
jgi:cytochrome c oxidase subunit 2